MLDEENWRKAEKEMQKDKRRTEESEYCKLTAERKKALSPLSRLEQRRKCYLGASSEEGAISARSRWDADSCAEREYYSGEVFANHHKSNHKYSIYLDILNKDFPTMVTTIRGSRTLRRTQRKRPRNRTLSAPHSNSGGSP